MLCPDAAEIPPDSEYSTLHSDSEMPPVHRPHEFLVGGFSLLSIGHFLAPDAVRCPGDGAQTFDADLLITGHARTVTSVLDPLQRQLYALQPAEVGLDLPDREIALGRALDAVECIRSILDNNLVASSSGLRNLVSKRVKDSFKSFQIFVFHVLAPYT
jgi:hypothetical protein